MQASSRILQFRTNLGIGTQANVRENWRIDHLEIEIVLRNEKAMLTNDEFNV